MIKAFIYAVIVTLSSSANADVGFVQDCPGPGCPAGATNIQGADPIASFSDGLEVNVRINFNFDSSRITGESIEGLQRMCSVIKQTDLKILVIGHTDGNGSEQYNISLSALRAKEVVRYMVIECGISADRLRAVGLGESRLLDPSNPSSSENRRIEFQAVIDFEDLRLDGEDLSDELLLF